MTANTRLYKRTAPNTVSLRPLWHVEERRAFFAGPLDYNARHRHSVPVYIAGLYAPFRLRLSAGGWLSCRTAVIPAGVPYELDVRGNPLAVLYLEPSLAGSHALMPLTRNTREECGAMIGGGGETSLMRELYEDVSSRQWIGSALDDLLGHSQKLARRVIDPRIAHVLESVSFGPDELLPIDRVAGRVGLSASRFQYLFTHEVGVPFRRYRAWRRLRMAISEIVNGNNFTTAAHAAGFADQAHFSHDFRKTFGAPASRGLAKVRA